MQTDLRHAFGDSKTNLFVVDVVVWWWVAPRGGQESMATF